MTILKQNADASMGIQGTDADDGAFVVVTLPYNATANASKLILSGPRLQRRMIVKDISGFPEEASSNAVTATVYKAPSATAIASGTALHSGTFNLQGSAFVVQTLTLAAAAVDVAAGNRLGAVISGAPGANAQGEITITLAPA